MSNTGAWTPAKEELLKQMWAKGYSAGRIEQRIPGVSRSAVLGKVRRMKLAKRKTKVTRGLYE